MKKIRLLIAFFICICFGANGADVTTSANVDAIMQAANYAAVRSLLSLDTANSPTFVSMVLTAAGAASTPAMNLSGAPYAAGTATTNFPLFYLNNSAATASTTLATTGTAFGVNSHGTADLMNLMLDGVSKFSVTSAGVVAVPTVNVTALNATTATAPTVATTDNSTNVATTAFVKSAVLQSEVTLTDGATITQTMVATQADQNAKVTLGGNRTLAFSGLAAGMRGNLRVIQDGTGSRTLTLMANSRVNGSTTTVTLLTAAAAENILSWYSPDGTAIRWTNGTY